MQSTSWVGGITALVMVAIGGASEICGAADKSAAYRESAPKVWVTWRGTEADKGASAWFLTRFVRPDVEIREVESGLLDLGAGKAFDVPQAEFRRTHQLAVYEQLQLAYPVDDAAAKRIGEIVHDIEINLWRPKIFRESALIQQATLDLVEARGDDWIPVSCYVAWFDSIYTQIRERTSLDSLPRFPSACSAKN